jgi:hypothetical protein
MSDQLVAEDASYTTQQTQEEHSCPQPDFEPVISAIKWLQTYTIDSTASGIGLDDFTAILSLNADNPQK